MSQATIINFETATDSMLLNQLNEAFQVKAQAEESIPQLINEIVERAVLAICQKPEKPNFRKLETAIAEISYMRGGEKMAAKIANNIAAYLDLDGILFVKDCKRAGDKKANWQIMARLDGNLEQRLIAVCNRDYIPFMEYISTPKAKEQKTEIQERLDKLENFRKNFSKLFTDKKLSKEITEHLNAIKTLIEE